MAVWIAAISPQLTRYAAIGLALDMDGSAIFFAPLEDITALLMIEDANAGALLLQSVIHVRALAARATFPSPYDMESVPPVIAASVADMELVVDIVAAPFSLRLGDGDSAASNVADSFPGPGPVMLAQADISLAPHEYVTTPADPGQSIAMGIDGDLACFSFVPQRFKKLVCANCKHPADSHLSSPT